MAISSRAGARDQDRQEFGARAPTTRRGGGPSARVELSPASSEAGHFHELLASFTRTSFDGRPAGSTSTSTSSDATT